MKIRILKSEQYVDGGLVEATLAAGFNIDTLRRHATYISKYLYAKDVTWPPTESSITFEAIHGRTLKLYIVSVEFVP